MGTTFRLWGNDDTALAAVTEGEVVIDAAWREEIACDRALAKTFRQEGDYTAEQRAERDAIFARRTAASRRGAAQRKLMPELRKAAYAAGARW